MTPYFKLCVRNLILHLKDILVLDLLYNSMHHSGMMSLACIGTVYYYSIIGNTLLQHCVLWSAMLPRCFICCLCLLSCVFFIWAIRATPKDYDLVWPCFACCLFCFLFITFPHRITPRPSRSKQVARSSGPLAPCVRLCTQDPWLQHRNPDPHQQQQRLHPP